MSTQGDDQSWVARALCASIEPDVLFVQGASQRQVWGGLTERERRAILRHYPAADNWLEWLRTSDEPLARELRSPHIPRVLSFVRPQLAGR